MNQYYANWARSKEHKYYPLIGYLTGVLGFPEELAKAEIARNWTASGAKASGDGTSTHLQIELCLNNETHASDSPEFKQYQAWRETHPTWRPYRTRVPARPRARFESTVDAPSQRVERVQRGGAHLRAD